MTCGPRVCVCVCVCVCVRAQSGRMQSVPSKYRLQHQQQHRARLLFLKACELHEHASKETPPLPQPTTTTTKQQQRRHSTRLLSLQVRELHEHARLPRPSAALPRLGPWLGGRPGRPLSRRGGCARVDLELQHTPGLCGSREGTQREGVSKVYEPHSQVAGVVQCDGRGPREAHQRRLFPYIFCKWATVAAAASCSPALRCLPAWTGPPFTHSSTV